LTKNAESVILRQPTRTSENITIARFRQLWTLTTEEWKAELELKNIGEFYC